MRYFTLGELSRSSIAAKHGIDNTPTPEAVIALNELVDKVLDPLREAWGGPIDVSSGYRCKRVNLLVGGARNSQHTKGQAADLRIYSRDKNGRYIRDNKGNLIVDKAAIRRLFQLVIDLNLPFDQMINENNYSWLHISYNANGNRGQKLKL